MSGSKDGGGIRGISTLLILQRIMEQIRDDCGLEETPRPCKYFSLIGGTSTGGIIAIMLGRLGMTVKQCLEAYKRMAEQAFTPKGNVFSRTFSLPASPQGRFSGKHLADAVKKIVKEYTGDAEAVFADKTCVKTVVLAVTKADVGALPTKFKTYSIGDDFKHCKIWEVARTTSAATTFFESISIGHQDIEFIDAGFGHNNPSEVLSSEAEDMFQDSTYDCMLSIGTGLGDVITIKDSRRSIIKALKNTDSISPHENTQRTSDHQAYNRREHRDARNGQDFNQTCLLVSAVLDFITLVQRDASTNALVDHMVQHHIPLQALQQVRSQQNIAQPVLLSNPVIVYTGFGQQVISFSLDEIGSLLEFQQFMSNAARGMLEDRFKAKGSAKFIKGEFLLQDENEHILSLRSPWKSIMKPGQRRNLSVKFRATATTACPHCQTENDFVEDEGTFCTIILNLLCGHKLDFKKATREAKEVVDKAQEPYNTYKEAQRIEEGKLQIQLEQLKNNMEAAAVTTAEAALKVAKNNNTAFRAAQAGLDPLDKINDAVYTTLDAAVQAAGTICDIRVARLTGTLIANKQEQKPFEIYLEGTLLKDELKLNLDLTPGETGKFLKDVSSEALALITPGKKKTV
ncbi:unnamed protein product [Alternaria alternata]